MHRLQELVRLHRMGLPARQVARELGMGPNTERRYRQILEANDRSDLAAVSVAPAHFPDPSLLGRSFAPLPTARDEWERRLRSSPSDSDG